jgi:hypothetical protein
MYRSDAFTMTTDTNQIPQALPCHNCGYDLRAHPDDGKCPECEASVAESKRIAAIPLRPAWRNSDPRWRRRILAGVWLLVLLPLMDLLRALKWDSKLSLPALFEVGGNTHTLEDALLSYLRVYQMIIFCMGVVLLFSKERNRRRASLDWSRRWGVLCSYVISLLCATQVLFITALVLLGISALCLSMPPRFQPGVTQSFIHISTAYLSYGPYPKDVSYLVNLAFSSIVILLACIPLYNALRSTGPKRLAALLLSPLAIFSLMHLAQAALYYFGFSNLKENEIYWLEIYFQPPILISYIAGRPTEWGLPDMNLGVVIQEAAKWCIVFSIAIWLSIAQFLAWRQSKNPKAA